MIIYYLIEYKERKIINMGKKKKKQRDSWDLTAEEQMELADAFYEAEKKGQLLKLDKDGKASKFTENGLEPGIEELIHQRLVASEHKNDENLTMNQKCLMS